MKSHIDLGFSHNVFLFSKRQIKPHLICNLQTYILYNSLPNNTFLDLSNLKAFADLINILNRKKYVAQKNTILNSPCIYTMKLSTCVMIKFWCSGNLL